MVAGAWLRVVLSAVEGAPTHVAEVHHRQYGVPLVHVGGEDEGMMAACNIPVGDDSLSKFAKSAIVLSTVA